MVAEAVVAVRCATGLRVRCPASADRETPIRPNRESPAEAPAWRRPVRTNSAATVLEVAVAGAAVVEWVVWRS